MPEIIVDVQDVTKCYGKTVAVNNLKFQISNGVSFGLVGRNGAGKTTLLRLVMGMLRPTAGTVRLFSHDPIREAEKAKLHVGYLAEDQAFPEILRGVDILRFFAECYPTWDEHFAASLIERFSIPMQRRLSTLSKGQKRQVALVCAVAHRPKLLILDEPGGGLDPVVRREFLEEVIELLAGEKTAVVFSSHHLQEVERIATRIGILHEGELILEEDLDALKEKSCQALVTGQGLQAQDIRKLLPACVHAAPRDGAWLLTMLCGCDEASAKIPSALQAQVVEVRPMALEDLFIAMVGGGR